MAVFVLACLGALAAIWAGYPLAIAALAALRPARREEVRLEDASVSIILATRDDRDAVRARVANLLETSYPRDRVEVIVGIDVGSGREQPFDLKELGGNVTVVMGDLPGGKAATLNAAVRAARYDILVFADTAQTFESQVVTELVHELADARVAAVSGMLHLAAGKNTTTLVDWYWRYERSLRKAEARQFSAVGVTGAVYAMRRALWERLPAGLILDDLYVPMRLVLEGYRVGFTDRARAIDTRRFAPGQEYRRKVRTLTGVIQLCAWLPGVLNPFRNPLWVQFVCHKLLRLLTPYLAVGVIAGVAWLLGSAIAASASRTTLVALIAALVPVLAIRPVRHMLASQIRWGFAMQSSVVVATVNGLRGRWDVWRS